METIIYGTGLYAFITLLLGIWCLLHSTKKIKAAENHGFEDWEGQ